jgi:hypothetical protein
MSSCTFQVVAVDTILLLTALSSMSNRPRAGVLLVDKGKERARGIADGDCMATLLMRGASSTILGLLLLLLFGMMVLLCVCWVRQGGRGVEVGGGREGVVQVGGLR